METSTNESKTKEIYTEVHDRDEFFSILKENPGIMVFKFGADWCAPCQTIKDDVEHYFANTPNNVVCFDLDIDDSFDLYAFLKSKKMVTGIPSILAYIKGNESFASDFAYSFSGGKDALKNFFDTVNIKADNL
jgi:thiol-disulfide isomerase/thioredoxin